jgi:uncharacterized membrane protein YfcA
VEFAFVAATGLLVGVINGMAGGASIISYPVLLAAGLSPLSAVVTNAVGVTSANFMALRVHAERLPIVLRQNRSLVLASVAGTTIGAAALLALPERTLERAIPFLMLLATMTLLIPTRSHGNGLGVGRETTLIFGTGLYCGYFGPGQGVMVAATLARDPRRGPAELNAVKNAVVGVTAMVSNVAYAFSGHVHWPLAATLAVGAGAGGYLGGHLSLRLHPAVYRGLLFAVGAGATTWLFHTYY